MQCPYCKSNDSKVIDKRLTNDSNNRRRRECLKCSKRFTTYEKIEALEKEEITQIKKRDGSIALFNPKKIKNVISKALVATGIKQKKISERLVNKVIERINERFSNENMPDVESIQDIVENVFMKEGYVDTAKAFILYRDKHNKMRETKSMFLDVDNTISEYLNQNHWNLKENSNEAYSFSGLLLHTAGKVIKNYALNGIYTPLIAKAHKEGYIHIHDLSNAFIGYCCGHSLKNLLLWGFGGVPNKVDAKPAKHMKVVIHQMVNYIGCMQMEFAGAQAFSSFDTLLAPFAKKDDLNYKEIKQCMQELVFSLNVPSRWGSQFPFSNITFDWIVPLDLKNQKAIVGGKEQDFTYKDCQKEMDMINRAFLDVMIEGDASGRIFSFPIPTYNVTKNFDWDSENATMLFELTAKYGTPYFQNYVGSDLDPSSVRAMCCRLNINQTELMKRPGGMWGPGDSTGSIGVVTLNLNRLAYESETKEDFFEKLDFYMIVSKDSLELKRKIIQKNLDNGLMPYTKRYLGTWQNHFSTIGLCGMHEACLNFLNKGLETEEGKEFAIETLNFMRDKLKDFQKETDNLYNLEATPAESTAYRFGRLDKSMYPDIIVSGEKDYFLTNSSQLSVDHTDDAIEALEHQNDIQPLYTGGTIFHTFLGERMNSGESCKQLIKKISYNTRIPYFSITPTFSVCKSHGYIKGEHFKCPTCNEETEVYSRIVGYYRPIQNWNAGKKEEFEKRVEYVEEKTLQSPIMIKNIREIQSVIKNQTS
ncbi:MAG: ribonucleoside triphosphate reductase [Nanoarchaeota archaeon]|nr:ribonucleoside triphosphate reductase [Nanoarchaeota archaeon]